MSEEKTWILDNQARLIAMLACNYGKRLNGVYPDSPNSVDLEQLRDAVDTFPSRTEVALSALKWLKTIRKLLNRAAAGKPTYFASILKLAELVLAEAQKLADWADVGPLNDTGAEMLLRTAKRWLALESAMVDDGIAGRGNVWTATYDRLADAAECLRDLACDIRKNADWFRYMPCDNTCLLALAPHACMGMPHDVFAKRLNVAVKLLKEVVADNGKRPTMTKEQANAEGLRLLKKDRKAFGLLSESQQARQIGCSWATWAKTELYKKLKAQKAKLANQIDKPKSPSSPPVSSLTSNLEAVTGEGRPDEVLHRLIEQERPNEANTAEEKARALADAIADHEREFEPSPLDSDPLDGLPRRVRSRKRL